MIHSFWKKSSPSRHANCKPMCGNNCRGVGGKKNTRIICSLLPMRFHFRDNPLSGLLWVGASPLWKILTSPRPQKPRLMISRMCKMQAYADCALLYRVWRGKRKITPARTIAAEKWQKERELKWQSPRWMRRNLSACFSFFLPFLSVWWKMWPS